jgi:hypothetical protein
MGVATTRSAERVAASLGIIQAAPILFERADDVPNGGVLCALGALLSFGLLRVMEKHFQALKGFYPIESIFLSLAFLALARIQSLEQLRYQPSGEWGKLLGLDRIPEVKTMREKLDVLSQDAAKVAAWSGDLAKEWMNQDVEATGVLLIDGHVRVYHGEATKLPRRYVSRERLCLRGTTDYWVNALDGAPFFCVTKPVDEGLIATIKQEIFPRLLKEVPNQPTEEELKDDKYLSRFTIVFDREGYSPDFFKWLKEKRVAILSYHKFPGQDWPLEEFGKRTITHANGEKSDVFLAERGLRLSNGLWVREIRKLNPGGHQTSVLSTAWKSDLCQNAGDMFARWNQENFFKYMSQHYGLDRLVEHGTTALPDTTKVINPKWRTLDSQVRSTGGKLARARAIFGALTLDPKGSSNEDQTAGVEKKAQALELVTAIEAKLKTLKAERKEFKKHIELKDLSEDQRFAALAPVRKQLMDTIKLVAYRAETALVSLARQTLKRQDDARSFVRGLFESSVNLRPDPARRELLVEIHGQTNGMQDATLSAMCRELNEAEVIYPGTDLRLIFRPIRSSFFPRGQDV